MITFLGFVAFGCFIWGIVALVRGKAGLIVGRKKAAKIAAAGLVATVVLIGVGSSTPGAKPATVAQATPAAAEPAKQEPAKAEPAKAEPAKAEPAKAEPAKAEPVKQQQAPAPLKDYIASVVNKEAGPTTNLDGKPPRIRENGIEVRPLTDGTGTIAILQLWANDNFSHNLIRTGILHDSTKIFRRIFTEREDAPDKVIIQWYFPGQDVKGNATELQLVTVTMTKTNAATFNWANFLYSELPKAADAYGEHPALSK